MTMRSLSTRRSGSWIGGVLTEQACYIDSSVCINVMESNRSMNDCQSTLDCTAVSRLVRFRSIEVSFPRSCDALPPVCSCAVRKTVCYCRWSNQQWSKGQFGLRGWGRNRMKEMEDNTLLPATSTVAKHKIAKVRSSPVAGASAVSVSMAAGKLLWS